MTDQVRLRGPSLGISLLVVGISAGLLAFSAWWWADWGWAYGLSGTVSGLWGLTLGIFFLVRALRRNQAENRGEVVLAPPQLLKGMRVVTVGRIGGWERPKVPAGSIGTVQHGAADWTGRASVLFIVPMGSWGDQQILTYVYPEEVSIAES